MRKRTNYKHQKKGKKMKQQKRKKEKLHGKFIDELWEEEKKMIKKNTIRKKQNIDVPYISLTPDWFAMIA